MREEEPLPSTSRRRSNDWRRRGEEIDFGRFGFLHKYFSSFKKIRMNIKSSMKKINGKVHHVIFHIEGT
jgi:hypothetical protein